MYNISKKQHQALQLLQDKSIVELLIGGSAGGAKSFCMGIMIMTLVRQYPGVRIFIGRKTISSLRQSTINTLLTKVHPMFGLTTDDYAMHWQTHELDYANGSLVLFGELERHPSDLDFARLGSLEIDCAFIDEAGEITLEAKNAIKSRVGRGIMTQKYGIPGKVISSCNPSVNFLRQEYYDPFIRLGGGEFQKWEIGKTEIDGLEQPIYRAFLRMSAYDNPFLPDSYIDNLKTLPDRERKRLLDGNWDYIDEDDSLFKSGLLDKAITYEMPKQGEKFEKYIGIDVADKGSDATVFSLISNGVLVAQKKSKVQMNWNEKDERPMSLLMADELINFALRNGFTAQTARHIAVETNGVGVGIRDALKIRGWQITEYVANKKSRSDGYYQLMLDMDSGDIKILDSLENLDELRRQLSIHSYEMDNQQPVVIKKADLKLLLGHSPDEADSFMIANWCRNQITNPANDPRHNKNRIGF